ncbi:hypothetical protein Pint_07170 [Pistacia integerrima]|uniref:Uncharacterized protein n=1 Tax=Pistacia integerrima TaxID=434235 RepID=A0ACC0XWM2_9ROSI|nr:hypothetical protein Pint_07170 [Pistacia integerrima]
MSSNSLGFDNLCRRFTKELTSVVISVNYRLAPEHKYPCQFQDGFDVIKFIEKNTNFEGFLKIVNLKQCFIDGDNAGGNLAHHVAVKAWLDRDHLGANVFGPKSEDIMMLKFPATLVIVGGFDPLQDWQRRYHNGLKKLGKEAYLIEYPKAFHAFYAIPMVRESGLCIKEIRDFMEKQCAK